MGEGSHARVRGAGVSSPRTSRTRKHPRVGVEDGVGNGVWAGQGQVGGGGRVGDRKQLLRYESRYRSWKALSLESIYVYIYRYIHTCIYQLLSLE